MEYRTLGNTGLQVSALSYGASSLGGVFREIDEAEGIAAVHLAVDLGINFIDVSPFYGITKAETVLGKALREIDRERYYISTKVGRYGNAEFDFSATRAIASIDESLLRLGLDYVDLILCHDIEFGSIDQVVEETIPALRQLQRQGKARCIGVTGLPLAIFRQVLARTEIDAILSYCRCCLNDTALTELLPELRARGLGVVNASPLSMGLLRQAAPPDWHPAPPALRAACAKAADHCRDRGGDLAKLAIQYAVAQPEVHTTLVSTANPDNLRRNVAAVDEPMDKELLGEVLEILAPVHNLTWPSGRPENN